MDAAESEITSFYSLCSSSCQNLAHTFTHNAARPLTVQRFGLESLFKTKSVLWKHSKDYFQLMITCVSWLTTITDS